jgi:selenocysteine lyase/cysteine desulfurase
MTSHVRSNDGRVQDVAAVAEAARREGAAVLLDASHSAGILPVRASELGLDYVVVSAYKHLLCPRGVAFFHIARSRWPAVQPIVASWRSAADPYGDSFYGGDLSALSPTASRYDVSLAWHAWVGALESLRFLCSVAEGERERWAVGLAGLLASRLGLKASGSSVLSVPVRSTDAAEEVLAAAGVVGALRAGKVRLSFHLYNGEEDVEVAARALAPLVAGGG